MRKKPLLWVLLIIMLLINVFLLMSGRNVQNQTASQNENAIIVPDVSHSDLIVSGIIDKSELLVEPDPIPAYTIAAVDVFSQPDGSENVLVTLAPHSDVDLIDSEGSWSRIKIDGETCYVDAACIRIKGESNGHLIAIDAGHQLLGNSSKEPVGPGSLTMKAKVTSGTRGKASGLREYELTLMVALKLQKELELRGYEVLMTRTTHDVNISNSQRAIMANEANADAFIRLHANGSDDREMCGANTLYQSAKNRYNGDMHEQSKALSYCVLNDMCKETGIKNNEPYTHDAMSGINWCEVPVTLLEMGYMTNKEEDLFMAAEENQYKIVVGIANGIDRFIAGDKE